MNKKGFSLIELLVVISIIGLLSTMSVVSLNSAQGRARDAAKKSDLNAISTAMELFNVESIDGTYPAVATTCPEPGDLNYGEILALVGGEHILCGGSPIITDYDDTILQAIPVSPNATDKPYIGFSDIEINHPRSYCISVELEEDGFYFKCVNGSCFHSDAHCINSSG